MEKAIKKTPLLKFLILFLCILIAVFIVSTLVDIQNKIKEGQYIGQELEKRDDITVSGKGEVYAQPDLALIDFSVITEKETVGEAMEGNTKKMNDIIQEIKNQGIEEKNLKTTNYSVYPRYEWHEATEKNPQGERVLVGYEVNQTLEVKLRDLSSIGAIIQKATEKGANKVSNLQLTIEDKEEAKKKAREEAIQQAKSKAKEIASQIKVSLGEITNFQETQVNLPRFYSTAYAEMEEKGASPEIQTGENKVEVTVNLTYEIN